MTAIWTKNKLSNLITIKHGYAFKGEYFSDSLTSNILVTPGNFAIGGGFQNTKMKYYNGPIPKDYILKKGDLIITMTDLSKRGDTLGYPAIIPDNPSFKYLHNQRIGLVERKGNDIDLKYLFYLLCTYAYQKFVVGSASGATVKHTSPDRICHYKANIPDKPTQVRIASVLSVYDDLIENNEKRIKRLEEMAQFLFAEWFVKFKFPGHEKVKMVDNGTRYGMVPEGWDVKKISDFSKFISRGPSLDYVKDNGIPVVNQRCIRSGLIKWKMVQYAKSLSPRDEDLYLNKYDCLINSMGVGTLGRVSRNLNITEKAIIHNCITLVRTKKPDIEAAFLYYFIKRKEKYFISLGIGTTGQTSLKPEIVANLKMLIPKDSILEKYSAVIMPLWDEIGLLLQNQDILQKTRDLLIPQLVTGKRELKQ